MSLKRILIYNKMKTLENLSNYTEPELIEIIKTKFKNCSNYLAKVCAKDLIKSKKDES